MSEVEVKFVQLNIDVRLCMLINMYFQWINFSVKHEFVILPFEQNVLYGKSVVTLNCAVISHKRTNEFVINIFHF
jgi:hypothetical protein